METLPEDIARIIWKNVYNNCMQDILLGYKRHVKKKLHSLRQSQKIAIKQQNHQHNGLLLKTIDYYKQQLKWACSILYNWSRF